MSVHDAQRIFQEPEQYDRPMYQPTRDTNGFQSGPMVPCLTVSEVERLAKAGVPISEKFMERVVPDLEHPKTGMFDCTKLLKPLVGRLRQAYETRTSDNYGADRLVVFPRFISVVSHEQKVYVFVASGHEPPVILEDDASLYPSDALMAKLFLMEKLYKDGQ